MTIEDKSREAARELANSYNFKDLHDLEVFEQGVSAGIKWSEDNEIKHGTFFVVLLSGNNVVDSLCNPLFVPAINDLINLETKDGIKRYHVIGRTWVSRNMLNVFLSEY